MIRLLVLLAISPALLADDVADYSQLVENAKTYIVADFKDPYSAKFEDIFIGRAKNGNPVVCGTVNGKNSYGAYTGRKRFYYMESGKIFGDMESTSGGFDILYDAFCSG